MGQKEIDIIRNYSPVDEKGTRKAGTEQQAKIPCPQGIASSYFARARLVRNTFDIEDAD